MIIIYTFASAVLTSLLAMALVIGLALVYNFLRRLI